MYCVWFDLYVFVWCVVQLTCRGIISFMYAWPWSPCICYFWFWGVLLAVLWIYSFPLSFDLHIFGRSFLKDLMHFLPYSANHISHKFWSTRAVEPELKPEAGAWNLGSRSTDTVSGASELQHYHNVFCFSMKQIVLESEPKTSRCWSRNWIQKIQMPGAVGGTRKLSSGSTAVWSIVHELQLLHI